MDAGRADAERDMLAILGAALREDQEGIDAVIAHCDLGPVIAALVGAVIEARRDSGDDPAEWVAARQARLAREELGAP